MIKIALTIITFLLLITSSLSAQASTSNISPALENAVLAGDWETADVLLKNITSKSQSPVKRLIKGHACLALNKNNESLDLFASALDDKSPVDWQNWTDRLVSNNTGNTIVWYLRGDAFARNKKWGDAKASLDKAISIDPDNYLALNARGVVAHAVGNTLMARTYFVKATKAKDDFADAYANRGTLSVLQNSVKGEEYFKKAQNHSADKEPYVSIIGLGCLQYGKQDYDGAQSFFGKVPETISFIGLIRQNQYATAIARLAYSVMIAKAVGTTLTDIVINPIGEDEEDEEIDVQEEEDGKINMIMYSKIRERWWEIQIGTGGVNIIIGGKSIVDEDPEPDDEGDEGSEKSAFSPIEDPEWMKRITITANAIAMELDRQTATASSVALTTNPGGADSDPSKAKSNRGPWGVTNVYGLLYEIPEK